MQIVSNDIKSNIMCMRNSALFISYLPARWTYFIYFIHSVCTLLFCTHSCCFIQYSMIRNQFFVIATVAIFICIYTNHKFFWSIFLDSVAFFQYAFHHKTGLLIEKQFPFSWYELKNCIQNVAFHFNKINFNGFFVPIFVYSGYRMNRAVVRYNNFRLEWKL